MLLPRPGLCPDSPLLPTGRAPAGAGGGAGRAAGSPRPAADHASSAAAPGGAEWAAAGRPARHPRGGPPVLPAGAGRGASGDLPRLPVLAPAGPAQHRAPRRPCRRARCQPQGGCGPGRGRGTGQPTGAAPRHSHGPGGLVSPSPTSSPSAGSWCPGFTLGHEALSIPHLATGWEAPCPTGPAHAFRDHQSLPDPGPGRERAPG